MTWICVLGAIFDSSSEDAEIAFRYAVIRENMYGAKFNLVPIVKLVDETDTYEAEQAGKCILQWKYVFTK